MPPLSCDVDGVWSVETDIFPKSDGDDDERAPSVTGTRDDDDDDVGGGQKFTF